MTEKDIRRLSRIDLLQLLVDLSTENEKLKQDIATLEEKLAKRELNIEKAGSMAEAALLVAGVLEAADEAAKLYLENIKNRSASSEDK